MAFGLRTAGKTIASTVAGVTTFVVTTGATLLTFGAIKLATDEEARERFSNIDTSSDNKLKTLGLKTAAIMAKGLEGKSETKYYTDPETDELYSKIEPTLSWTKLGAAALVGLVGNNTASRATWNALSGTKEDETLTQTASTATTQYTNVDYTTGGPGSG